MPAQSEKQRKFFGIVKSIQNGDTPASYSKKAAKVAKDIDPDDAADFAKNESIEDDEMSLSEIYDQLVRKYRSQ